MKRSILAAIIVVSSSMISVAAFAAANTGETLFKEKCASCHPDGGNIMKPAASIKGIKSSAKIIKQIRKGGSGMPAFDAKAISDANAKQLADYIMKTFKK